MVSEGFVTEPSDRRASSLRDVEDATCRSQWPRDDVLGEEQPRSEPARVGQCRQRRREPHARGEPDRRIEGGRHDGGQPEPFDERECGADPTGRLGLPAVVSSALDTSVGLAAGVRLAAALPTLPYACGLGTGLLLAEDVVTVPLRPVGGMLDVAHAGQVAVGVGLNVADVADERTERLVTRAERALRNR